MYEQLLRSHQMIQMLHEQIQYHEFKQQDIVGGHYVIHRHEQYEQV